MNPEGKRFRAVDGLRGIAVLLVLVHHFIELQLPRELGSWQAYLAAGLSLSFSGVDLFFVISGYLIGGILLDHRDSANFFQVFYLRRFLRIFPLYYVFLAICWFLTAQFSSVKSASYPLSSYLTLFCNFWMARGWDLAFPALAWSLAVEEQFYIVFPFLVRFLRSSLLFRLTLTALFVAPVLRVGLVLGAPGFSLGSHVLTACRMDSLAFGVLVAMAMRHSVVRPWLKNHAHVPLLIAVACVPALLYLTYTRAQIPSVSMAAFGYSILGMFYSAVLLAVLQQQSKWLVRVCEAAPLVFLGGISYFVYLFQGIVAWGIFRLAGSDDLTLRDPRDVGLVFLAVAAILLLGKLSFRFFEAKLISFGHRYRYHSPTAAHAVPLELLSPR